MTQIRFSDSLFSSEEEDSIGHVLRNLVTDGRRGLWREPPEKIDIRRRIAGGRSGAAVLEADVIRGNSRSRVVIKIGPFYELRDEFAAFHDLLPVEVRGTRFVPIETVTHRLLESPGAGLASEHEAVVYNHAEYFHGVEEPLQTLEEIARRALQARVGTADDAESLDVATQVLARLFDGTRNALYDRWELDEQPTTLRAYWNRPLGLDAVIEISSIDVERNVLLLVEDGHADHTLHEKRFSESAVASDPPSGRVAVQLGRVRLQWRGPRLIGEIDSPYFLRFEIVGVPTPIKHLPNCSHITNGTEWTVSGVVHTWRTPAARQRLLHFLGEMF